jgi:Ca2+-binding EF-hand superfamily protein
MLSQDGGKTIGIDQVIKPVRMAGQNPSNRELSVAISQVKLGVNDRVTFEELVEIMKKCWSNENYEEELNRAFKVFDKENTGRLNKEKFRFKMMNKGEKLNEKEYQELISLSQNHENDADLDINCNCICTFILKYLNFIIIKRS